MVYAPSGGWIEAVDRRTRTLQWRYPRDGGLSSDIDGEPSTAPLVVDDALYYGTLSGRVWRLDAATGRQSWLFAVPQPAYPSMPASEDPYSLGVSGLSFADGRLVATSRNGTVFALDAETGDPVWTTVAGDAVYDAPAVTDGLAYCNESGDLVAPSIADG